MSAFKFIGYYDEKIRRVYDACNGLKADNISKIYYHKDTKEYLFLKGDKKRIPTAKELERIHIFVIQKEMLKRDWATRAGTSAAILLLASLLKYAHSCFQDSSLELVEDRQETQVTQDVGEKYHVIDVTDIKNKLIAMINMAEVNVEDRNYRILYYLYYFAFIGDLDNGDFLEMVISENDSNARLSYQDYLVFYMSNRFNYQSVINDPKGDSLKATYENLDMFLELNMLIEQEVLMGNITQGDYDDYIRIFGESLRTRDPDLYRVWFYKVSHSSMFGKLVNLKYLVYEKIMDMPN